MARSTAKPRQKNTRARKARSASTSLKPARHAGKKKPIDLYYWPTPNGWKITIMLEECSLPYTVIPVDISRGDQFKPQFLAISPNNRMPAIVDHDGPDGRPISIFDRRYRVRRLGEPCRAPRPRNARLSQRQALARNFAGASRGQTRSVGQGGSGLSRRHEGPEGARNSVQSEGALSRRTYAARPIIEVLDGARRGRYGGSVAGDVAEWLKAAVC